ncbi:hypothetical protein ACQ4PT_065647 [Festuca glaucescens]
MGKRPRSDSHDEEQHHLRAGEHHRGRRGRLHLIVRDYKLGCSVYKLDVDSIRPDKDHDLDSRAERLPPAHHAAIRLASPDGEQCDELACTGSKPARSSLSTLAAAVGPRDLSHRLTLHGEAWTGAPPWLRRMAMGEPPSAADKVARLHLVPRASTLKWTRLGGWHLPFIGKAYFVRELDAWVGLCPRNRGYISVCEVISPDGRRTDPPACTSARERVYCNNRERHLCASLTYMGNAEFCLLETVTREGYDIYTDDNTPKRMLLRLATFRVERRRNRELRAVNMRTKEGTT